MVTTGVILAILAVIAAIGAAYRVRDKRARGITAETETRAFTPPSQATVRESDVAAAQKSSPQGDRDLTEVLVDAPISSAAPQKPVMLSPIAPAPDVDVPLAASLSVSELVQSESTPGSESPQAFPNQAFPNAATPDLTAAQTSEPHKSVLEEVAHLGQTGQPDQVAALARHVYHADPVVRVAVAAALGEMANRRHGQGVAAIVPILSKLSQDANAQVRLQAVIALGGIQSSEVLPLLEQAQRQTDTRISQAASAAIQNLKWVQPQQSSPVPKPIYDQQQTGQTSHS